jgi:hypothetical protein
VWVWVWVKSYPTVRLGAPAKLKYLHSKIGRRVDFSSYKKPGCSQSRGGGGGARARPRGSGFFYTPFLSRFYGIQFYGFRVRAVQQFSFHRHFCLDLSGRLELPHRAPDTFCQFWNFLVG